MKLRIHQEDSCFTLNHTPSSQQGARCVTMRLEYTPLTVNSQTELDICLQHLTILFKVSGSGSRNDYVRHCSKTVVPNQWIKLYTMINNSWSREEVFLSIGVASCSDIAERGQAETKALSNFPFTFWPLKTRTHKHTQVYTSKHPGLSFMLMGQWLSAPTHLSLTITLSLGWFPISETAYRSN